MSLLCLQIGLHVCETERIYWHHSKCVLHYLLNNDNIIDYMPRFV